MGLAETRAVMRSEHLWMRRDRAEPMLRAIAEGDAGALRSSYRSLFETFAEAQRKVDEWRSPEEVFSLLQRAGIIGIGGPASAMAELHDDLAAMRESTAWVEAVDDSHFDFVAGGIQSGLSTMSLLRLLRNVQASLGKESASMGFIFNDCRRDLVVACDHRVPSDSADPYFHNSFQTLGPSQTVLPARGMVLNPVTGSEHDCVAMCPWGSEGTGGPQGTFVSLVVQHPVFKQVGLGWGVPGVAAGDQGARAVLHELGGTPVRARDFFHDWENGRVGSHRAHWRSDAGAALILDDRDGETRVGQIGATFFDLPSRRRAAVTI